MTPFGKYPKLIEYTLGKMISENNSNMPDTDTYENNAYTRYLKDKLNIQNRNVFEGEGTTYNNMVTMAIVEEKLPDIMVVEDYNSLKILVENDMIEDLTVYYEEYASDKVKDIYASYGDELFEQVFFSGKMMAFPETIIDAGPNLIWLRKDWLDQLNLTPPENIADLVSIVSEFLEKDPGNNGKDNQIGLVCTPDIISEYIASIDMIFANYGVYLQQWIENKEGKIVYSSIQPEAKKALKYIAKLYKKGIIDNQFLLRTNKNIEELIIENKCGAFFGKWWTPNNPLMEAYRKNPEANWQPYLLETSEEGVTKYASPNSCGKYVVVRKGYSHPEIVIKMHNVLFGDLNYNDPEVKEIMLYYQKNVDPTARPCAINLDYSNALERSYYSLIETLNGRKEESELGLLEHSYYEMCQSYLKNEEEGKISSAEEWAAYTSRIQACNLLTSKNIEKKYSKFYGETAAMDKDWLELKKLEKEAYLKIITGEKELSYFDEFVIDWRKKGGDIITKEVREEIKKNNHNLGKD